jgi:hypothetical protein
MAIIRTITLGTRDLHAHTTEVDSEYQEVSRPDGSKLFQLSTFGSDDRVSEPKVSQTIQLDEERATALVSALRQVFPGLVGA